MGLLIAGAVSGDLVLVYASIALAALALLLLLVAVVVWRHQLFGPRAADLGGVGGPAEQSAGGRTPRQPAPVQPQEWRDREPVSTPQPVSAARGPKSAREPIRGREPMPGRETRPADRPD